MIKMKNLRTHEGLKSKDTSGEYKDIRPEFKYTNGDLKTKI